MLYKFQLPQSPQTLILFPISQQNIFVYLDFLPSGPEVASGQRAGSTVEFISFIFSSLRIPILQRVLSQESNYFTHFAQFSSYLVVKGQVQFQAKFMSGSRSFFTEIAFFLVLPNLFSLRSVQIFFWTSQTVFSFYFLPCCPSQAITSSLMLSFSPGT